MNEILNDRIIYETKNFIVCVPKIPHIPREDGGHIWIRGRKNNFCSRLDLDSNEAIEVMRLTMLISEATKIKLNIKKIKNNGDNNKLMLDDLFKNEFMLYPTEEVQGIVGIYGERMENDAFPMLDIDISYVQGNDNKSVKYSRTISYIWKKSFI